MPPAHVDLPSLDNHAVQELIAVKITSADQGPSLEELEGYGEAKTWGLNLAADLATYRAGEITWADIDTGILIAGPPGVGKTHFARALARSCGISFLAGSLGQWQAARYGHLGTTLSALRSFFDQCQRAVSPVVIALIDEIDSFGDRAQSSHHKKDYSTQVVNAPLECLDGSVEWQNVIVVGATNNPHRIDFAINRPGRFDRTVEIPLPDAEALRAILRYHLGPDLMTDVFLDEVAGGQPTC
ncbi:MAG TPA: AAA family ATPase [Microvirga sp.]|jgi:SpoVK/Ycf46/Vps4 family AAA+-type ATPase|nr:AAA family ATPase [Microvirga sp.]